MVYILKNIEHNMYIDIKQIIEKLFKTQRVLFKSINKGIFFKKLHLNTHVASSFKLFTNSWYFPVGSYLSSRQLSPAAVAIFLLPYVKFQNLLQAYFIYDRTLVRIYIKWYIIYFSFFLYQIFFYSYLYFIQFVRIITSYALTS